MANKPEPKKALDLKLGAKFTIEGVEEYYFFIEPSDRPEYWYLYTVWTFQNKDRQKEYVGNLCFNKNAIEVFTYVGLRLSSNRSLAQITII